jgi:hypothetical protein
MNLDQAIELFTKTSECGISRKECIYCYGMSKMTIPNENRDFSNYYLMKFVEFLEMICRIADLKYKSADRQNLGSKVEMILDELFVVLGKNC